MRLTSYSASITIPSVIAFGKLLDFQRWSKLRRGWLAFAIWVIPQAGAFIWIGIEYSKFGQSQATLDYGKRVYAFPCAVCKKLTTLKVTGEMGGGLSPIYDHFRHWLLVSVVSLLDSWHFLYRCQSIFTHRWFVPYFRNSWSSCCVRNQLQ
jgi:hypothetical protein